jgi:peptidoglycan/LPS O-acetylase OafA/YrhL
VSVEAFFYLLFPLIAFLAIRTSRKAIPAILVLIYVIMLVGPALFVAAGLPTNETNLNHNPDLMALRFNPMVRLPEFVFGVLVGRFTEAMPARLPPWTCGAVAATIVATLYLTYYLPPAVTETFVENGLYAPLFTLLIVTLAKSSRALLSGSTWVHVGNASYALYIIHMPLWGIFRFAASLSLIPSAEQSPITYLCYMAVILGGAQVIHAYIEQPLRHAIRKRLHAIALTIPADVDDRIAQGHSCQQRSQPQPRLSQRQVAPIRASGLTVDIDHRRPIRARRDWLQVVGERVDREPERPVVVSARSQG